jgi:hypothetical protein
MAGNEGWVNRKVGIKGTAYRVNPCKDPRKELEGSWKQARSRLERSYVSIRSQ